MLNKLLQDLRFTIGVFFAIIGVILIGAGPGEALAAVKGLNLNLVTGLAMTAFAGFMIASAIFAKPPAAKGGASTKSPTAKRVGH